MQIRGYGQLVGIIVILITILSCQHDQEWLVKDERQLAWIGRIYDTEREQWIESDRLLQKIRTANILLLGERHDHPDHWRLHLKILQEVGWNHVGAIVFEHFDRSQQSLLDELIKQKVPVAEWKNRLNWDKSGWPDWEQRFQAIIQAAVDHGISIIAGNLDRADTKKIYQNGFAPVFEEQVIQDFQLDKNLPSELEKPLLAELERSHCHPMAMDMQQAMLRVQRARDASMAYAVKTQRSDHRFVVFIAGNGHIRKDWGVPYLLSTWAQRKPSGGSPKLLTLAFEQAPDQFTTWAARTIPYDYVWLTPAKDLRDPCEIYRKELEKFKSKPKKQPPESTSVK